VRVIKKALLSAWISYCFIVHSPLPLFDLSWVSGTMFLLFFANTT
jgi:hypothetical protein